VAQIATLRSIVTLCSRRHDNSFTIPLKAGRIPFTISGGVDGLYPGAVRPLTLHVDNPHRFRIKVRSLKVRVGSTASGNDRLRVTTNAQVCGGAFKFGSVNLGNAGFVTANTTLRARSPGALLRNN